jgi:hypothetical protein
MAATTTDLSIKTIDYPAFAPDSRQMAVIQQNLEGEAMQETDLIRVRTPLGGGTQWTIDSNGNTETVDELVGLLVGVGKRGVLWPYEDPSEARPVIVSNDLLVGYRTGDAIGDLDEAALEKYRIGDRRYDWRALADGPEFGYGGGRGAGKRCKEARILAILRQGETWPVLVTVGPGSLKNVVPWLKRLPCFQHEAVIGLRLVKAKGKNGQPYSQIVPRLVGQLTEEQGAMAKRVYTDPIMAMFTAPPAGAGPTEFSSDDDE